MIQSGRYKDHVEDDAPDLRPFWEQVEACEFEVLPGPGQRVRWGALRAGQHDDFLISAAPVTFLDQADWAPGADTEILPTADPLVEVDGGAF